MNAVNNTQKSFWSPNQTRAKSFSLFLIKYLKKMKKIVFFVLFVFFVFFWFFLFFVFKKKTSWNEQIIYKKVCFLSESP
jgi:hypothetical protein